MIMEKKNLKISQRRVGDRLVEPNMGARRTAKYLKKLRRSLQKYKSISRHHVGKEWAVVGGLNQLESTTKLPVVLTRGASTKMVNPTIVDFNLFQLEKWLNQLRLIPG